jgi:hypothetical protein
MPSCFFKKVLYFLNKELLLFLPAKSWDLSSGQKARSSVQSSKSLKSNQAKSSTSKQI